MQNRIATTRTSRANLVDVQKVTQDLLRVLDSRSRDVVSRRFGLTGQKRETLESIGQEYGITRERVRQIESNTRKTLANLQEALQPVAKALYEIFRLYGGVMAEPHIVEVTGESYSPLKNATPNIVRFYLHILPEYLYVTHHPAFEAHWRHRELGGDRAEQIVTFASQILKKEGKPIKRDEFLQSIRQELEARENDLPHLHIEAALVASRPINSTVFEEWGLKDWAEVSPRGVGDKAYAVLRRHGKPAHFREITTLINEAEFDGKKANPQTVHNELIKDERFVLVGRGLYGLREWGYIPGTVADVLEAILKKAERPLTRDELIERVLEQRMVKKNTILLGLQNAKRFAKTAEDRYTLRRR